MKVINVRNVNSALPIGLQYLEQVGVQRESRNGPVLVSPVPVSTVYQQPLENVLFSPERDANPFFHLYEALWMLAGRNDVYPLVRYVKRSTNYSDDGRTLRGAYGYRWRNHFCEPSACHATVKINQLTQIAQNLSKDPTDRRSVLQMWDAEFDLGVNAKDLPCNVSATFQIDAEMRLNLVVFCRSNDIVWGAYGANAVQFSMLLEYMSKWIRPCVPGTYTQVSVNYHGYLSTIEPLKSVRPDLAGYTDDPYRRGEVVHIPMPDYPIETLDSLINLLLLRADKGYTRDQVLIDPDHWFRTVDTVLRAHHVYRNTSKERRHLAALEVLADAPVPNADWVVAARLWIMRREERMKVSGGNTNQG